MKERSKRTLITCAAVLGLLLLGITVTLILRRGDRDASAETVLASGSETAESFDSEYWDSESTTAARTKEETESSESQSSETGATPEYTLKVTVLNVGQGSAAVLESSGEYMVIDCGDIDHAQTIVAYLKKVNPEKIKYLCLTHHDLDHVGGAKGVLLNFPVSEIWIADYEADTRTYYSLMETIKNTGIASLTPKPGRVFTLGACTVSINGPVKAYEEENSNSIAMTITDGTSTVYFGGDATVESETDTILSGYSVDSDVYVCNHHGSSTSSSELFVEALSPRYTIISCDGINGGYGHPTRKVLNTLKKAGSELYRTDTQGDIIFYFKGENGMFFEQEPTDNWEPGIFIESWNTINQAA